MTVAASERRFYGLAGNSLVYTVNLKMPFCGPAIVWREPDGVPAPTTEIHPPAHAVVAARAAGEGREASRSETRNSRKP